VLTGAQHRQTRHAENADVCTGRLGATQAGDVFVDAHDLSSLKAEVKRAFALRRPTGEGQAPMEVPAPD
jgi:hypothetical protein